MHRTDTDSEVQRLLRPLSTQWVQSVTGVSRDAVAAWRSGTSQPREDRWEKLVAAVAASLPETNAKEAAPEGAAPPWALELSGQILNAIELNRKVLLEQVAAQYAEFADALLSQDIDDAEPPGMPGQRPRKPGPRPGQPT